MIHLKQVTGFAAVEGAFRLDYTASRLVLRRGEDVLCDLSWSDVAARHDFGPCTWYAYDAGVASSAEKIIAVLPRTLLSKERGARVACDLSRWLWVHVIVPFADAASFDDCEVMVVAGSDFSANVPVQAVDAGFAFVSRLPRLSLAAPDSITADGTAQATVRLVDAANAPIPRAGVEVFLEATAGYLPKRRVTTAADGSASVRLRALGLEPGDVVKLKAGFKHFTGSAEALVTVV